ncbi:MAG: FliI/YscN family ATPase [Phycisphaerales bacterium]
MSTLMGSVRDRLREVQPMRIAGPVSAVRGLCVHVDQLPLPVGSLVSVAHDASDPRRPLLGEVVGFGDGRAIVMLMGQTEGVRVGDMVVGEEVTQSGAVGTRLLGRVIDGLGRPVDGRGAVGEIVRRPLNPAPLNAMSRSSIRDPLHTGVRAVDLMTTLGRGQRMGVFAGPGVGKSTLLGTMARRSDAEVNVVALIGERGREVRDFIEHSLGEDGLRRSVVIVATGDESPLLRVRAAKLACTVAEFFREQGRSVLLMMDSITRFAHAQRQIGLAAGEPPTTKGYTPSVFSSMALLLERAGSLSPRQGVAKGGSVTGLYTILVDGDDMTEPVADAARGILDGHLILSRKLAQKGHFPAVDVLDSVSRVADDVTDAEHQEARRWLCRLLALYREVEDLVQIGAYAKGSSAESDAAIEYYRPLTELLRQGRGDTTAFPDARRSLLSLAKESKELVAKLTKPKGR